MHLYLHIPFCKQKCSYCNFHFSTVLKHKTEMIEAICKELELRKNEINQPLETIYFGGGTPSILTDKELGQIFNKIEQLFEIQPNAEITLEANPDDLNAPKVKELRQTPVNRFSIGIQSFFNEDLQLMNRAHSAQEADASIKRVQDAGFENITIDLIYGAPTTTDTMWKQNLQKTLDLQVPHVSSYALTVEPKTILQHQISKGILTEINDARQQNQFNVLVETLTQNGFDHYEISNFGKQDFHSKHNSAYWKGKCYIGIGPSAHSYNVNSRAWNISNNTQYIKEIQQNKMPQEIEHLSHEDILNELTMIGLRTNYGIDLSKLQQQIPEDIYNEWFVGVERFSQEGKLMRKDNRLFLNPEYRFFADGIASELFVV